MRITREEVEHVARLARLELSGDEVEVFGEQLSNILENIGVLNQVETGDVPPTAQVTGLENVLRADSTWGSLAPEQVLANAPQQADGFFVVQHVFEETAPEAEE